MNRTRMILLLLILVVVVALVVVVVLPSLQGGSAPAPTQVASDTNSGTTPQQPVQVAQAPTSTPEPRVEVVIAVQELGRGQVIPPNGVALREWPAYAVPVSAITNLEDVVGQIARTDIFREQPIQTNMVVENLGDLARTGSDAAAVLPSGLVAVSLPIDRITSVGYAIQDGDRVDLIISLLYVDVDEEFQSRIPSEITLFTIEPETNAITLEDGIQGRPDSSAAFAPARVIVGPSEQQRPRLVTQMTIQDALIIHVGTFPLDGRFIGVPPTPTPVPAEQQAEGDATPVPTPTPARPDIVTLAVTPQEAVVITYYVEAKIPVTLALRSATDTSRVPTDDVTLEYLMGTYGIELPPRLPYSIEPAIRSIRQLVAGELISLQDEPEPAPPPPAEGG
ncbi:MAG: Flp pilus assembly protein CpaB [Anaerolineae bacterium]|nr:Flp pilus assembly protein CpaB [Anaerolineae bacterium]